LRFFNIRRNWPTLAAVVIGIAVALVAAYQLYRYTSTHKEMVRVPVPVRDIPPYTVLSSADIGWRAVVKGGEEPGAVRDPSEAVGKLTLSALYQNEQIKRERLADAKLVKDKQIISVNVDVTRSVGGSLRVGDLVDVWWIPTEGSMQTPGVGWIKVAANAVVLDIRDSSGKSVLAQQEGVVQQALAGSMGAPATPPAVVILAIDSKDVSRVIGGASPKSQNIVLSKKFAATADQVQLQQSSQNPNEQGGETGAEAGAEKTGKPR